MAMGECVHNVNVEIQRTISRRSDIVQDKGIQCDIWLGLMSRQIAMIDYRRKTITFYYGRRDFFSQVQGRDKERGWVSYQNAVNQ